MDSGTQADQQDVGRLLMSWNGIDVEYDDKFCTEPQAYWSFLNPILAKVSSQFSNPPPPARNHCKKECPMTKGKNSVRIKESI